MLATIDIEMGCIVVGDDEDLWTIRWPDGVTAEIVDGGAIVRDQKGVIIADERDRLWLNGHKAGFHPLCMFGRHFEATEIVYVERR